MLKHLFLVPVNLHAAPKVLTSGVCLETNREVESLSKTISPSKYLNLTNNHAFLPFLCQATRADTPMFNGISHVKLVHACQSLGRGGAADYL